MIDTDIEKLKEIEKAAYGEDSPYLAFDDIETMEDLRAYCAVESTDDIHILSGDTWYCIIGEHKKDEEDHYMELVDLASAKGKMPIGKVVLFCMQYDCPFVMDARENTSYKIIKLLADREDINIKEDTPYTWGGEIFHQIKIEKTDKEKNMEKEKCDDTEREI